MVCQPAQKYDSNAFTMRNQPRSLSASGGRPPSSRRRDKPQLSCNTCRKRKLKCDRQRPCQRCLSHGISTSCIYPSTQRPETATATQSARAPGTLQQRLEDLEEQILSIFNAPTAQSTDSMPNRPQLATAINELDPAPATQSPKSPADLPDSPNTEYGGISLDEGRLDSSPAGSLYVDASHWTAILDNISELKEGLQKQDGASADSAPMNYGPPAVVNAGPQLLFGCNSPTTKETLLAAMPERSIVDRLIFDFTKESGDMFLACLHMDTFQKQYDEFWESPNDVSYLWLGLLYSVMSLSSLSQAAVTSTRMGDETILHNARRQPRFLNQVVHCLILGNYPNGGPHALEALLYYLCIENARRPDSESSIWVLVGTIVRLAFRMGYHRDPSQLRGITPFAAELRRRMWAVLYYGETMFSIQTGVPRMIDDAQCDTQPPSNLLDADFDESTVVMPTSRPSSEFTPVQLTIIRFKLAKILSSIASQGNAIEQEPAKVRSLEEALERAYEELPTPFKMGNGRICFTDTPYHILCRLALGVLFQKCKILLYRRWLNRPSSSIAESNENSDNKGEALIQAALKVLEIQEALDRETQPEGILWAARWKLSSIIFYEFHMAAAVLTAIMYRTMEDCPIIELPASTRSGIIVALKKSHLIWAKISARSREALKSINMLDSLFSKIESSDGPSPMDVGWESTINFENGFFLNGDAAFDFHF